MIVAGTNQVVLDYRSNGNCVRRLVKRRHGLSRCRYKTDVGKQRWVGLGVISDDPVNIGRVMSRRPAP
jgi:hypothetical protein